MTHRTSRLPGLRSHSSHHHPRQRAGGGIKSPCNSAPLGTSCAVWGCDGVVVHVCRVGYVCGDVMVLWYVCHVCVWGCDGVVHVCRVGYVCGDVMVWYMCSMCVGCGGVVVRVCHVWYVCGYGVVCVQHVCGILHSALCHLWCVCVCVCMLF